jgi:hypothetical protein
MSTQNFLIVLVLLVCINASIIDNNIIRYFELMDRNNDRNVSTTELIMLLHEIYDEENLISSQEKFLEAKNQFLSRHRDLIISKIIRQSSNDNLEHMFTFEEFEHAMAQRAHFRKVADNCPQQVRLALGMSHSQIIVIWVTVSKTGTYLRYGTTDKYIEVQGETYTYTAGGWNGTLHKVRLDNLIPSTKYSYIVGDRSCWSNTYNFTTLGAPKYPSRINIFGDMGTIMPMGLAVSERMIWDHTHISPFDLTVHIGDISYAGGAIGHRELPWIWDSWGRQVEPLSSVMPYMVTVGNHENFYNFTSYINRFEMPSKYDPSQPYVGGNFYYSYDWGPIHFISMCSECNYTEGSHQHNWLIADMTKANQQRDKTPWVVLLSHRTMYSSEKHDQGHGGKLQQIIEPIMKKHKVDFGIYGHVHMYERTYPVYRDQPDIHSSNHVFINPENPIHLVIGCAGALIHEDLIDPQPTWSAYRALYYGYVKWNILNETTLNFQYVDMSDRIQDEFWVIKK